MPEMAVELGNRTPSGPLSGLLVAQVHPPLRAGPATRTTMEWFRDHTAEIRAWLRRSPTSEGTA